MRHVRALVVMTLLGGLLLGLSLTPQLALAANITVGNGLYTCDQNGLAAAITDANPGGTVTFNCSSPYTINFTSRIIIGEFGNQVVTIDGSNNGHPMIFDGGNSTNFFRIWSAGNLTLKNLTMQRGSQYDLESPDWTGGAIVIDSEATLTATAVAFSNNRAYYGGAIYSQGATVTINQSSFTSNSANYGGAIYNLSGAITIDQCTFENNSAVTNGGAVNTFNAATVISRSSFVNNQASAAGAVMAWDNFMSIVASTFTDNAATFGSAVYANSSVDSVRIAWSTIIQPANTSPALYIDQTHNLTLEGVILGGDGNHCGFMSGATLTDIYTLANDDSCGLEGVDSVQGITDLGLGSPTSTTRNGIEQTYIPLLAGSPAIDRGPDSCDTDILDGPDPDQLGNPRPFSDYCDIGAIETTLSTDLLCANQWNGAVRLDPNCGRSEIAYKLPQEGPVTLCVNQ